MSFFKNIMGVFTDDELYEMDDTQIIDLGAVQKEQKKYEDENRKEAKKYTKPVVKIIKPVSISEAPLAMDHLLEEAMIIADLSMMPQSEKQSFAHTLSGSVFALEGTSTKIGTDLFIFTHPKFILDEVDK